MRQNYLLPRRRGLVSTLILFGLLMGWFGQARAQQSLYYLTSDGNNSTNPGDALNLAVPPTGGNSTIMTSVAGIPNLMTLDLDNNRVVIHDAFAKVFKTVNLSTGTIATVPVSLGSNLTISGIEYDPGSQYLYYLQSNRNSATDANEALYRITLAGATSNAIATQVAGRTNALALDLANNQAIINDAAAKVFKTINLTSGAIAILPITQPGTATMPVTAMRFDPISRLLYYVLSDGTTATTVNDALYRTNLSGTANTAVATGIGASPSVLALDVVGKWAYFYDDLNNARVIKSVNLAAGAGFGTVSTLSSIVLNNLQVTALNFPAPTTVTSIMRAGASPTNAASVSFTVNFARSVTGVSAASFALATTDITGASIASVSGSGASYTVVVNTGSGQGTVGLNLVNSDGITPAVANVPFTGEIYAIDRVAPTATISSTASNPTATSVIPVMVTFSEPVTGFTAAGLSVINGTVSGFAGSGSSYSFTLTAAAQGVVAVNLAANVAQDAAGNGNPAAQFSITYSNATSVIWNGSQSTDWFTAGNWTGGVPTSTLDALIPAGVPRYPLLTTGTATAKTLTLASGGSLTATGGTLDLKVSFINNGTFTASGGTVVLSGTAAQTVGGSSLTRFWNLTVGTPGAAATGALAFQRLLTLNGNMATAGYAFTLQSTPALTAMVVNSAGVVTGTATVERAIDGSLNPGVGYRHYSAPVANSTVGDLATSGGFSPVLNIQYNSAALPGMVSPFPTVYGYDQTRVATAANNLSAFDKGWFSPAALSDALVVGRGYTVNLDASQLVDFVGTLNNGDQTQTLGRVSGPAAADGGWQLVGNPYSSPLDYGLVAPADRPNLDAAIYVFESTSQYTGSYRANVNGVGGNANSPNAVLALGQGFFVRVSNGQTSGSLTLRNSHRLTAPAATTFRRGTAETRPLVQLNLLSATGLDPVYVYFEDGATAGVDHAFDAVKLPNSTGLNVSAETGAQRLAINALPALGTATVTVPLTVGVPAAGSYAFTAAQLLNLGTTPVYLRDRQTGAVVDLARQPGYNFVVGNASALISGRFELVFSPQAVLATAPAALAAQVGVYPNPATTTAFVEMPAALGRVAVVAALVDALGRTVRTQVLPAQGAAAHRLDLATLPKGLYILHLNTSAGLVVKKLVVQ